VASNERRPARYDHPGSGVITANLFDDLALDYATGRDHADSSLKYPRSSITVRIERHRSAGETILVVNRALNELRMPEKCGGKLLLPGKAVK
jgi:hypothetical protein